MQQSRYVIGVDVGTGSARAGVFDPAGHPRGSARSDFALYRAPGAMVEHSSAEIWRAVCIAVRAAMRAADVDPAAIAGIGFDATCSLVVVGQEGAPLAVGPSGDPNRDTIVWMDHRALDQAARITALGHPVLAYVGGIISPEMQTPKLLWLHEHRRDVFDAAWQFFDLVDYLTWRATGCLARSSCTLTCKWTYLAHENRWDASYFAQIGLGMLAEEGFARIGTEVVPPGSPLGQGLSGRAAAELGLAPGTPVGAGLIDAHAGGVGTVGAGQDVTSSMAYVFGTSSCTMTTAAEPVFVPGIWGPYRSAMVPDHWLIEGGQSAAGAAMDQLLAMHPAAGEAATQAGAAAKSLPGWLADCALARVAEASDVVHLAQGLHVVPEFLGNRAPFADPHARAVIAGLGMDRDIDSLVRLYVAGLTGIGYGLRQIIAAQAASGAVVARVVISGGAGQHPLVRQILADATGLPVVATRADEPVLLGSAMLGAVAGGLFADLAPAMAGMSAASETYLPARNGIDTLHRLRYDAFVRLQGVARDIRHEA